MKAYDVISVGGGLGGSALAKAMAELGARVLVVERETQFKDRVRGAGPVTTAHSVVPGSTRSFGAAGSSESSRPSSPAAGPRRGRSPRSSGRRGPLESPRETESTEPRSPA